MLNSPIQLSVGAVRCGDSSDAPTPPAPSPYASLPRLARQTGARPLASIFLRFAEIRGGLEWFLDFCIPQELCFMTTGPGKPLASNRKAWHDYFIEERYEAGISLTGTEVKALREGRANLQDSFARIEDHEVILRQCHISPYSHGGHENHDPLRPRKLLLHRSEINRLAGRLQQRGVTLVPLQLYLKQGRIKVELGLARGKQRGDKRETLRRKVAEREVERAMKPGRRER